MKVAVLGLGAMGCLFAGRLASEAQVTLVGHWPQQLAALNRQGLSVAEPCGRETAVEVRATAHPSDVGPTDLALVLVKSHQTATAARQARLLAPRLVVTLQNGAGNLELLTTELGRNRTALGTTAQGATLLGPGRVRHAGAGPTQLAARSDGGPDLERRLRRVAALFCACGLETELVAKSAASLVWDKLVVNAAINPLTALLGVPNGDLLHDPRARRLMDQAAREAAAVARRLGIDLSQDHPGDRVFKVCQATACNRSSMLQDLEGGRKTEIVAICGAVAKEGRRHRVATPLNELFVHLVGVAEARVAARTAVDSASQPKDTGLDLSQTLPHGPAAPPDLVADLQGLLSTVGQRRCW